MTALSSQHLCHFNGCENIVVPGTRKCESHKKKGICTIADCRNQVYRGGVCVRHGARSAMCSVKGCTKKLRVGDVCHFHAAHLPTSPCAHKGCTSLARGTATCKRHSLAAILARHQRPSSHDTAMKMQEVAGRVVLDEAQDAVGLDEDILDAIAWCDFDVILLSDIVIVVDAMLDRGPCLLLQP
ncbi:Aste57867_9379 [Aphanomyces stellatus]|uniref:Aste57867_9379 protein n=1 Tax=Aphanomyces stellatus TaxID=120398 RepID=A0A485KMQ1_9STRA|nr:hypothetical protein As57867_009343 [Aphanomyces stellatus]VFT86260.1 Aste57867_9379 [Aphanomyces stellatus]